MKRIFSLILFLFTTFVSFAQELPDLDAIPLGKAEDFNERADGAALASANYLLSTPFDEESMPR